MLNLNYQILSTHAIDFDDFSQNNVKATDYLWKKNCLECFIQINNQQYFEINASPNGAYALYHFDDYRTPKQNATTSDRTITILIGKNSKSMFKIFM